MVGNGIKQIGFLALLMSILFLDATHAVSPLPFL